MTGPSPLPIDGAFMAADPRTRAQRLLRRLFPYSPMQPGDEPAFSTETTLMLCWRDRLRVLVSGCVRISHRHVTDVEVKRVVSSCVFYIESPLERT